MSGVSISVPYNSLEKIVSKWEGIRTEVHTQCWPTSLHAFSS